jgi:flagellar biosynthesis protein FliR
MSLFSMLNEHTILAYLLILCRLAGMIVGSPIFNMHNIPPQSKVGFAAVFAFILYPLHSAHPPVTHDVFQFAALVLQETIIGLLIGFIANLTFMGVQMAGELMSMQMGLSAAQMLNPVTGTQNAQVGQFFFYFATIVFFGLNIHHALIAAVDRSFTWLPLGHFIGEGHLTASVMTQRCIHLTSEVFLLALTTGIPVMSVLLVTEVATGFVAKVMPQMNVFMVAIPIKLMLGLLIMIMALPAFADVLGDQYAHLVQILLHLYKS